MVLQIFKLLASHNLGAGRSKHIRKCCKITMGDGWIAYVSCFNHLCLVVKNHHFWSLNHHLWCLNHLNHPPNHHNQRWLFFHGSIEKSLVKSPLCFCKKKNEKIVELRTSNGANPRHPARPSPLRRHCKRHRKSPRPASTVACSWRTRTLQGAANLLLLVHWFTTGWGPQDSVQLPYFSGFMVDITIVNRAYFMVYKPTYNWGAPSCTLW